MVAAVQTPDFEHSDRSGPSALRKKPRKSRGRGLRTKTGCLTCRKRHKKCDEQEPVCGSCRLANRACVYGDVRPQNGATSSVDRNYTGVTRSTMHAASCQEITPSHSSCSDFVSPATNHPDDLGLHPGVLMGDAGAYAGSTAHSGSGSRPIDPVPAIGHRTDGTPVAFPFSPDAHSVSLELLSAGGASTRWLDLLATDAAQADTSFSLAPTAVQERSLAPNERQHLYSGGQGSYDPGVDPAVNSSSQQYPWQQSEDIFLLDHERVLFRQFVEHAALWLDVMDPQRHFSTYAIRLALRNLGLMNAILALSARHATLSQNTIPGSRHFSSTDSLSSHEQAIQYYYETLRYLQMALQHRSYTLSEEILATAIIISTYEMLDESASNWQRHLKGVFWIQRSQDVDGASGGLRQAVWWAWLRQDIWAAFREKRACFSFWLPVKDCSELPQHELANRAIYLLSQAVNFAARQPITCDPDQAREERKMKADQLFAKLESWKKYLGPNSLPLPTPKIELASDERAPFQPIWIHPPNFALALMAYNLARILITLHRPAEPGFSEHLKIQKTLQDAVAKICGIAMALDDEGCQILSAQCLYGAGLCVHRPSEQAAIIALIEGCEQRTGWPMSSIRDDLHTEWQRINSEINAT